MLMAVLILAISISSALAQDQKPKQASVALGPDGKLVYTPDERGNLIPDFSRSGYMGGGVKIPDVPVKATVEPRPGMVRSMQHYSAENAGEGDDTQRIQEAIDRVSAMRPDKNGHRGAVLLKRGLYRVLGQLFIRTSGVVLRGEGQGGDGTILLAVWPRPEQMKIALIQAGEAEGKPLKEIPGSRRRIADAYVPMGAKSLNMESVEGLSVGSKVVVFRPWTKQWAEAVGIKSWIRDDLTHKDWSSKQEHWGLSFRFEREIVAMEGNRITLDAPIVQPMEDKYGGGYVYRYEEPGRPQQVGIERLRLIVAHDPAAKRHTNNRTGVALMGCVNSWVRNVTGVHFSYATAETSYGLAGGRHWPFGSASKFVTIQDCAYLKPLKMSRYAFPNNNGQLCLFQRLYTENGRHVNQAGAWSSGPNVYLDCYNRGGDVGPHHRWAMGTLYDNTVGGHIVPDRRRWGAHGWSGAQIVFWNAHGGGHKISQPPTARNYWLVGTPRSLYLQQLEERLGPKAVENITTKGQRLATTRRYTPETEGKKKSQRVLDEMSRDKLIWQAIVRGIGEQTRENNNQ